jgi:hypothetical protein
MGYLVLFFVFVLAIKLFEKWAWPIIAGHIGESFVSGRLDSLDPQYYRILNDVMLSSKGSTETTQIDNIVVCNFGIFCIETKAYKGWIFGDANQEYWTQVIYRYKKRFYNPLKQNYAHVKAVEDLIKIKYPYARILSFVAFPNAEKIKISGTDSVGYMEDILKKIKNYNNPILSDTERDDIYQMLSQANISDKETRRQHIQSVREIKNSNDVERH